MHTLLCVEAGIHAVALAGEQFDEHAAQRTVVFHEEQRRR